MNGETDFQELIDRWNSEIEAGPRREKRYQALSSVAALSAPEAGTLAAIRVLHQHVSLRVNDADGPASHAPKMDFNADTRAEVVACLPDVSASFPRVGEESGHYTLGPVSTTVCPDCRGGRRACPTTVPCTGRGCRNGSVSVTYEERETCPTCDGRRYQFSKCPRCVDAPGFERCRACRGTGYPYETDAEGRRRRLDGDCRSCRGDGRVRCTRCVDGRIKGASCRTCSASGDLRTQHKRQERCERCGGRGVLKCGQCDGEGSVKCPTCDGCAQIAHWGVIWRGFELDVLSANVSGVAADLATSLVDQILEGHGEHVLVDDEPTARRAHQWVEGRASALIPDLESGLKTGCAPGDAIVVQLAVVEAISVQAATGPWSARVAGFGPGFLLVSSEGLPPVDRAAARVWRSRSIRRLLIGVAVPVIAVITVVMVLHGPVTGSLLLIGSLALPPSRRMFHRLASVYVDGIQAVFDRDGMADPGVSAADPGVAAQAAAAHA